MKKYYAYIVPGGVGERGVTDNWPECERMVSGKAGARFMGFRTHKEAKEWLGAGAVYTIRKDSSTQTPKNPAPRGRGSPRFTGRREPLERGIYFDAGTGRGLGRVEVNVTDEHGTSLLAKVPSPIRITKFGTHTIPRKSATNNYGELFACKLALEIAKEQGVKKIFGDSKLVIDYWSRGHIKGGAYHKSTYTLVKKVTALRREFEERGGVIQYISGDINPADLGFHR